MIDDNSGYNNEGASACTLGAGLRDDVRGYSFYDLERMKISNRHLAALLYALHFQSLMVADSQSHSKAAACRDRRYKAELPQKPSDHVTRENSFVKNAQVRPKPLVQI